MFRSVSISVGVFLVGVYVGVGFSQTSQATSESIKADAPNQINSKKLPSLQRSHRNDDLRRRVLGLEKRVLKLERERLELDRSAEPLLAKTADGIPAAVDERRLVSLIGRAIRDESSPIRADVSEVVKDQFENMRSEWRAFRKARREIHDEEFLSSLMKVVDLSDSERAQLDELLADERVKIGEIRATARETFDIRGARDRRRALRQETDDQALEVLGSDGFETWKELRQKRRGPGRR